MKPLSRVLNNNLANQHPSSQELIAELEVRLIHVTNKLHNTNASLEREVIDRLSKKDEFQRSTRVPLFIIFLVILARLSTQNEMFAFLSPA